MMASCLILNNFSSIGAVVKAAVVEQNEIDSFLNGDENTESINPSVEDSMGGNESEQQPILPENEVEDNNQNEIEKPEGDQSPEKPEVEIPSEGGQPEVPDSEIPSEEEPPGAEEPEGDMSDTELPSDEEQIEDLEELDMEIEALSLEDRSSGSGLVQLWQVVPDGQQSKEGKTTSEIMKALQCKPNHNLYPSGSQSEHSTYVNSCYVDDAFYLGEDSNYYHIYLSGYEGKVPKSESHWFELDLNNDGKKVSYEIRTVAYYIPGTSTYAINETEEKAILDVPELNFYNETLDKYSDFSEKGIQSYSTSTVQSPSYYVNDNGILYHYITSNVTRANNYSKVTVGKAPSWMSNGVKYYSYDGIYFYSNWRNIKVNGQGAVNQMSPFYNYYQYLPFRSKSNYVANVFDNYTNSNGGVGGKLVNTGQYFYAVQDKYGINGALQYAMGIHESGWGKSSLSIDKNNLFGMNATDNNPYGNGTSFPSVEAGINYHADRYLSWGYTDPIDDWRYMGSHVGNKGSGMNVRYASDPFWGEKIAGWYYRFDNASGLKDYDYYTIGIKQSNTVVDVKSQANSSSSTLYQTKNKKSNVKISNYPVLITGEQNGFYKVKTDTPIVNGVPKYSAQYNWDTSNGFVSKNNINSINNTYYRNPDSSGDVEYIGRIMDLSWSGDRLVIQGYGELSKYPVPWWSSVTHQIVLVNQDTQQEYSYDMNPEKSDWLAGDPHGLGGDYSYAQFSGNLNLNALPIGRYDVYHETTVGHYTHREKLYNNAQLSLPATKTMYGNSYILSQYSDGNNNPIIIEKIDAESGVEYIGRAMDIYWSNDRLVIQGYGELAGYPVPWWSSVTHQIVLVNQDTQQEYSYTMNPEKSTWLAGDPHGLGGDYSYAQYSGNLNLNSLPVGKYDIYHETTVSGYTQRQRLYNNANISLPTVKNIGRNSYKFNQYDKDGNNLITLEKLQGNTSVPYTGRMIDMYWKDDRLVIQGYGELAGYPVPWWSSVTHQIILINQETKEEYSYVMNPEKSTWLAGDPHGLGGDYSYAQYSGNLNLNSLPVGKYDIYHETIVSGYSQREKFNNNAQLALPDEKNLWGVKYTFNQYSEDGNNPIILVKE